MFEKQGLILIEILFQDLKFTVLNLHSLEVNELHANWRNAQDIGFLDFLSQQPMIFSGVMDTTVGDSEIYKGNFIFED